MKPKNMRRLLLIISIIGVLSLIFVMLYISTAHASDEDYQICVSRCYLDLPKIEECVEDEKTYWDSENTSVLQVKRTCKEMINYKKIDCRINCATAGIKIEDAAVKYYDTNVKNFPLTDE